MSKKKNKKFKKQHHQSAPQPSQTVQSDSTVPQNEIAEPVQMSEKIQNELKASIPEHDYSYVKKDVFKILTLIGIIAILFVAFYFIGAKTSWLSSFGDWIYKICNIKIE